MPIRAKISRREALAFCFFFDIDLPAGATGRTILKRVGGVTYGFVTFSGFTCSIWQGALSPHV